MPLEMRDQALLLDIRQSALDIRSFMAGIDEATFLKDLKTQRAVERALEIVGEAAKKLSPAALQTLPKVPFRQMIGMRNILAHEYGKVDPQLVWQTASVDIPALLKEIR